MCRNEHEQAADEMEAAVEISEGSPFYVGALGHVYAVAGRKEDALRIVSELEDLSIRRHVSPFWGGMIYSALCQKNEAFQCLERALEEHAPWIAYLKVLPWFDDLRSDARFYKMLQRMNIPI